MSEAAPIRVLVLAAYPAVRAGLRSLLEAEEGIIATEVSPDRIEVGSDLDGDVIVADLGDDPERLLGAIEDFAPGLPLVLLGDTESFEGIADAGPRAYLLREAGADELGAAVRAVEAGLIVFDAALAHLDPRSPAMPRGGGSSGVGRLTERELEVLRLIALGLPNKGIALRLAISEHTVKFHVGAILSRLGAASRTEAVMLAARRGLLPL